MTNATVTTDTAQRLQAGVGTWAPRPTWALAAGYRCDAEALSVCRPHRVLARSARHNSTVSFRIA